MKKIILFIGLIILSFYGFSQDYSVNQLWIKNAKLTGAHSGSQHVLFINSVSGKVYSSDDVPVSNLIVSDTIFIGDSSYIVETTDTTYFSSEKNIKIGNNSLVVDRQGNVNATTITADTLRGYHDPGYKVFAANITEPSTLTSGKLVPGVRYTIEDYVEGDDFTNVGSSYDSTGAVFVATGETPNSWLGWSTLAPNDTLIVNVLQNTIGNIEVIHNLYIENEGTIYGTTFYSPDSLFSYNTSVITNEGEFLMNKYFTNARRLSSKYVNMRKMRFYGATLDWDDDRCKATNQYIEIRVYP